jgi:hypothetical protein
MTSFHKLLLRTAAQNKGVVTQCVILADWVFVLGFWTAQVL